MKIVLSILAFCIWFSSFAQTNAPVKNIANKNDPTFYLDSIPIEMDYTYMDVNKIEKVDVLKNALSSKVFITSKNPKSFKFLSYSILKNTYFKEINKPIILLVNGDFIKNPTKINIDQSYIYKVEVEKGDDFEELKKMYPDKALVNIKLNNLNNKNGERKISLQGMPIDNFPQ